MEGATRSEKTTNDQIKVYKELGFIARMMEYGCKRMKDESRVLNNHGWNFSLKK